MAIDELIRTGSKVITGYRASGKWGTTANKDFIFVFYENSDTDALLCDVINKSTGSISTKSIIGYTAYYGLSSFDIESINDEYFVMTLGLNASGTDHANLYLLKWSGSSFTMPRTISIDIGTSASFVTSVAILGKDVDGYDIIGASAYDVEDEASRVKKYKFKDGDIVSTDASYYFTNSRGGFYRLSKRDRLKTVFCRYTVSSRYLYANIIDFISDTTLTIGNAIALHQGSQGNVQDVYGIIDCDTNTAIHIDESDKGAEELKYAKMSINDTTLGDPSWYTIDISSLTTGAYTATYMRSPILVDGYLYDPLLDQVGGKFFLLKVKLSNNALEAYALIGTAVGDSLDSYYMGTSFDGTVASVLGEWYDNISGQDKYMFGILEFYTPPNWPVNIDGTWKDSEVFIKTADGWTSDGLEVKVHDGSGWKETS